MTTMRKLGDTLIPVPPLFKAYFKKDLPEDILPIYTNQLTDGVDSRGLPILIPKDYNCYDYRETLMPIVGYTLVTKKFCKALASFIGNKKVLEIMAGTGCLSYGLRQEGVKIHATDDYSEGLYPTFWLDDLERLDCVEAVRKYGAESDYLLMSWCPNTIPILTVLQMLKRVNPMAHVIYIGEGVGGCTGRDVMWQVVTPISYDNFYGAAMTYRSWYGLHDRPYLLCINDIQY